ncbi:MAG: cation:proton antiporter [Halobacteriales archaeon]|nr:cation:proton antiporter [Halobacteriales archaeon]
MADALLVVAAVVVGLAAIGYLAHRLRLPPALGYLVFGVVLSPSIASTPTLPPEVLAPSAHIAVLVVLFLIGLEMDLRRLREVLGNLALVLPFDLLVPALAAMAMARVWGWGLLESLALGFAVTTSSTLFGERLTAGFPSFLRQRVIGVGLAEDVAAAGFFGVIALLGSVGTASSAAAWWTPFTGVGKLLFLFVLLTAAGLLLVPRALDAVTRRHSNDLLVLAGAALVLGFGWLGSLAGSAELGALVAGVAAAEAGSRFVVRNSLAGLRDVALALFFFTSGLAVDPLSVVTHPGLVAAIALAFGGAKLLVHVPAGLAAGLPLADALRAAFALGTLGEMSLILVAAAQAHGIAHPLLGTGIVGAMLVLLVLAPLLIRGVPALARLADRIPAGLRRPLWRVLHSLRHTAPAAEPDPSRRRNALRLLLANVLLLLAWVLLCAWAGPRVIDRYSSRSAILLPMLVVGVATAVAAPLLLGTYRRYRDAVGNVPDMDAAAGARARLVDAWLLAAAVLVFAPLGLLVPRALPVFLGGFFLAIILAVLAWRQLHRVHRAVEASITRVLGHDAEAGAVLDRMMEKYPWGVRSAAVAVPGDSPLANAPLGRGRIRELTGATVAVLQRNRREVVNPGPEEIVRPDDLLVLLGDAHQLARAEALIVAHGEALRMTAQSRLATVAEVTVREGSSLVGQAVGPADLRGRTGSVVVGLWPGGTQHPLPAMEAQSIRPGDRLILLGTPLQVERARLLCEGQEFDDTVEARSA